ncbi:MAG: hypothetical protein JRI55_22830 [Deltaproteobacteria bacterium]|nr:hypothetical protein [Deltaproteobacteria bacterium]
MTPDGDMPMNDCTAAMNLMADRDPAAKRWADQTAELLRGYCREVHDCSPAESPFDEKLIFTAAWQLYRASAGSPCWSQLDPVELIARFAGDHPPNETLVNTTVVSLVAFYTFLVKHEHLSRTQARSVLATLQPLWLRACSWALAQLSVPPGDESPQRTQRAQRWN